MELRKNHDSGSKKASQFTKQDLILKNFIEQFVVSAIIDRPNKVKEYKLSFRKFVCI